MPAAGDLEDILVGKDRAREVMRPKAAHHDEQGTFPREILQQASELGLMNMTLPSSVGGNELSHVAQVLIGEELAWGCAGMATSMRPKRRERRWRSTSSCCCHRTNRPTSLRTRAHRPFTVSR